MKELGESLQNSHKMSGEEETSPVLPAEANPDIELEPWEREVAGMHRAIQLVQQKADNSTDGGFNGDDILAIHRFVLNDPFNPHFSGKLRRVVVKIGSIVRGEYREANFVPVHPDDLPDLFGEFSNELESKTGEINTSSSVAQVVETSTWVHNELIRIHPFKDGNGRTARLLVDYIFKRAGLPYLTDWGAESDEYKDVIDRTFKENNMNLFRKFIATKLLSRTVDVGSVDSSLSPDMERFGLETKAYIRSLKQDAA